ncbi:MAG: hypothetical protein HW403_1116 [Dehalococcoidia bacterium]|nr:hypothetical protein [Dehalococcoidia bacterium]
MSAPVSPANFELKSGELASLEVIVDPAAHGEAGLGSIQRGAIVETAVGQKLEFVLNATVVR